MNAISRQFGSPSSPILVLMLWLALPAAADACSCKGASPCRALWGTRAVFAGTVTDIQELPLRDPATKVGSQRVIFSVARGYRNVTASRIEIIVHPDEVSCGYEFKKGKQYLVYASSQSGFLTTGLCTRTRELARAAEDIAYLTLLQGTPDAGRVSGRVIFAGQQLPREFRARTMSDVSVILRGAGFVREGRTDAEGNFEFRGVPPVSFSVAVVPPWPYAADEEIEVDDPDPRQCTTGLMLQVRYDGRIKGVLMDGRGRPLSGIKVQAWAAEGGYGQEARTTASGHYELTGLSPGSYVVGVNLTVPPTLESPYARVFAPGTTDRLAPIVGSPANFDSHPKPRSPRHTSRGHVAPFCCGGVMLMLDRRLLMKGDLPAAFPPDVDAARKHRDS